MMSKCANKLKNICEPTFTGTSMHDESDNKNQIPNEVFDISRLLAKIAVDEYFEEVKRGGQK